MLFEGFRQGLPGMCGEYLDSGQRLSASTILGKVFLLIIVSNSLSWRCNVGDRTIGCSIGGEFQDLLVQACDDGVVFVVELEFCLEKGLQGGDLLCLCLQEGKLCSVCRKIDWDVFQDLDFYYFFHWDFDDLLYDDLDQFLYGNFHDALYLYFDDLLYLYFDDPLYFYLDLDQSLHHSLHNHLYGYLSFDSDHSLYGNFHLYCLPNDALDRHFHYPFHLNHSLHFHHSLNLYFHHSLHLHQLLYHPLHFDHPLHLYYSLHLDHSLHFDHLLYHSLHLYYSFYLHVSIDLYRYLFNAFHIDHCRLCFNCYLHLPLDIDWHFHRDLYWHFYNHLPFHWNLDDHLPLDGNLNDLVCDLLTGRSAGFLLDLLTEGLIKFLRLHVLHQCCKLILQVAESHFHLFLFFTIFSACSLDLRQLIIKCDHFLFQFLFRCGKALDLKSLPFSCLQCLSQAVAPLHPAHLVPVLVDLEGEAIVLVEADRFGGAGAIEGGTGTVDEGLQGGDGGSVGVGVRIHHC